MEIIKEYNFRSVVITQLEMDRHFFVTKETMENYYKQQIDIDLTKIGMHYLQGERMQYSEQEKYRIKHEPNFLKESTGDDLELFFENLQIGKIKENSVSFFLPKAKADERKVVEEKNTKYASHYLSFWEYGIMEKIDVDKTEMALSESNSKFIFYCGQRETTRFENIPETINRKRKAIERQLIARA